MSEIDKAIEAAAKEAVALSKIHQVRSADGTKALTHWTDFDPAAFRRALAEHGMVVVPREPTEAMLDAAVTADRPMGRYRATIGEILRIEYRAMIAAAEGK